TSCTTCCTSCSAATRACSARCASSPTRSARRRAGPATPPERPPWRSRCCSCTWRCGGRRRSRRRCGWPPTGCAAASARRPPAATPRIASRTGWSSRWRRCAPAWRRANEPRQEDFPVRSTALALASLALIPLLAAPAAAELPPDADAVAEHMAFLGYQCDRSPSGLQCRHDQHVNVNVRGIQGGTLLVTYFATE